MPECVKPNSSQWETQMELHTWGARHAIAWRYHWQPTSSPSGRAPGQRGCGVSSGQGTSVFPAVADAGDFCFCFEGVMVCPNCWTVLALRCRGLVPLTKDKCLNFCLHVWCDLQEIQSKTIPQLMVFCSWEMSLFLSCKKWGDWWWWMGWE